MEVYFIYCFYSVFREVKAICTFYDEYKVVICKVLAEFACADLPVLYNGSFGHNEPRTILPYCAMAEIDCTNASFTILESATV